MCNYRTGPKPYASRLLCFWFVKLKMNDEGNCRSNDIRPSDIGAISQSSEPPPPRSEPYSKIPATITILITGLAKDGGFRFFLPHLYVPVQHCISRCPFNRFRRTKNCQKKTNPTVSTVTYLWDRSSKYSQARYFL